MVYFKENYNFPRFQRGVQHVPFGGGSNFFQGGGGPNANFYRKFNHRTCEFPGGGGVRTPYPPLDLRMYVLGAQKKRLTETVLLSTHNICFG